MNIASIILGIVSIVCQNPITAIIGLILGIKEANTSGKKIGLILNIIGLIVAIIGCIVGFIYGLLYGFEIMNEILYELM